MVKYRASALPVRHRSQPRASADVTRWNSWECNTKWWNIPVRQISVIYVVYQVWYSSSSDYSNYKYFPLSPIAYRLPYLVGSVRKRSRCTHLPLILLKLTNTKPNQVRAPKNRGARGTEASHEAESRRLLNLDKKNTGVQNDYVPRISYRT